MLSYVNKRRLKYYGSLMLVMLSVIFVSIFGLRWFESEFEQYNAELERLKTNEVLVVQTQYLFKLQVQEWKNILLRGKDPVLFDKYYESFSEQFYLTQLAASELAQSIPEDSEANALIDQFLLQHNSILANYSDAIVVFKSSNFDGQLADERVRGIDRKPDQLLRQLASYLSSKIATKRLLLQYEFEWFRDSLIIGFILTQAILFLVLARQTGRLLRNTLHDHTTQVGNRTLFLHSVDDVKSKNMHALIAIIDIDEFKIINESCGSAGGDEFLEKIAGLATKHLGEDSVFCRISGDQFGLIIFGNKNASQSILTSLLRKIARYHFVHGDIKISLTCSASSIFTDEQIHANAQDALNKLYVGMQIAKKKGANQYTHFSDKNKDIEWLQQQLRMVHAIPSLLDNKQAVLYKQAINPLDEHANNKHFEVLLRVKNQDDSISGPGLFLQTAERFHLIAEVDRYVIRSLISHILANPDDHYHYSINLSGQTLSDLSFIDFIEQQLQKVNIDTSRLHFEITETEIIKNLDTATEIIRCLKRYQCKIYLDDFGTGMSSYAYIAKLGLDVIKIDGTFIKDLDANPQNQAIVRSVVSLAKQLNIQTVAEFVENSAEFEMIKALGVDYAQGYLLHKPEPIA